MEHAPHSDVGASPRSRREVADRCHDEADQREQGLQRLVEALERYPQLFAEPLWRDGFVARLH